MIAPALRLAGTGKTALIPHIADAVPNPTVAAMTHKVAAVLHAKGLDNTTTLHAFCQMKPIFAYDYIELPTWFTTPDAPYPALPRNVAGRGTCREDRAPTRRRDRICGDEQ